MNHVTTPIIAVTGSVGKTSVTTLIQRLLEHQNYRICVGGNIGYGILSLIQQAQESDYVILEISSFQAEIIQSFNPKLVVWTNFYPNHLDRHNSINDYFQAKYNLIRNQHIPNALVPTALKSAFDTASHSISCFDASPSSQATNNAYTIHDDRIIYTDAHGTLLTIAQLSSLSHTTFVENWMIALATLHKLGISAETTYPDIVLPAHRLEAVPNSLGIAIYNDSKATVAQATCAAINQLARNKKPILLMLGGLSKGVDRHSLIQSIPTSVRSVIAFGKEQKLLVHMCNECNVPAYGFDTLEEAIEYVLSHCNPDDQLLFSPSGASFDLFNNYQERGESFKRLIKQYQEKLTHSSW